MDALFLKASFHIFQRFVENTNYFLLSFSPFFLQKYNNNHKATVK